MKIYLSKYDYHEWYQNIIRLKKVAILILIDLTNPF